MASIARLVREFFLIRDKKNHIEEDSSSRIAHTYSGLSQAEQKSIAQDISNLMPGVSISNVDDMVKFFNTSHTYTPPKNHFTPFHHVDQPPQDSLSIVSRNVEFGEHMQDIARQAAFHPADIYILQEANIGTSNGSSVFHELADATGMHAAYVPNFYERDVGGITGNMILSRFPIVETGVFNVPAYFDWDNFMFGKRVGHRAAQWATIDREGELYHLVNVHIESHTSPENKEASLRAILEQAHEKFKDGNIIVAGDFNTLSYGPLNQLMEDHGYHGGTSKNTVATVPRPLWNKVQFPADHVYTSFPLDKYDVIGYGGADHLTVRAEVNF